MKIMNDIRAARGPLAAFVAEGFCWGSFAGVVPAVKRQAELSDSELGTAMLVGATAAFCAMWLAPWLDRVLQRFAMPLLAVLMSSGFILVGQADGWSSMALALVVCALGAGTLDVTMNARLSEFESSRKRPLMNMAHGIFSLSYAIAALSGGVLRELGWSPFEVFVLVAVVNLLLIAAIWFAPVSAPEEVDANAPAPRLNWAVLLPIGMVVLIGFMAEQGTEGWSALHLERAHDAGAAQGALGPAILGLTMAFGRFSGQALSYHMTEARALTVAAALSATGAVIAAWGPGLISGYLGFGLLGLGVSVVAPMAFAWAGRLTPSGQKAKAISRVAVLGYAGFFIGPPMMGGLSQAYGLSASFTAVALLLLLVSFVLVPLVQRSEARS